VVKKMLPAIKRLFLLSLLACALLIFNLSSAAAEPKRIALLPFKINAEKDLSYLRDGIFDMLTTRLARAGQVEVLGRQKVEEAMETVAGAEGLTEDAARKIGASLSADFVLYGSLTVFGDSASLDTKMIDLSGQKPTLTFFDQSQAMGEVIPRINAIAAEINEKVFGSEPSVQQPPKPLPIEKPVEKKPAETSSIYAHPEKLLKEGTLAQGESQGGSSAFVMTRSAGESAEFWKSGNFEMHIQGLALGDVDGDGATETVIISNQKILILRIQEGRLLTLEEVAGEKQQRFFWVDVADIKQNGIAEIFVSCVNLNSGNLESFVLEWNGKDFETIASRQKWYLRVLEMPGRGPVLLGQKMGADTLFYPGIYEMTWSSGSYESAERLSLPKSTNIFEFALGDVMNTGNEMLVTFETNDFLQIQTLAGKKEWTSDARYGGSENFIRNSPRSDRRTFLPQRIFVTDLNQNGQTEVTVVSGYAITGVLFSNYRSYSSGQFVSLSWDGFGLSENWHTNKISGYFSDSALGDIDNDGQPELVAAVVSRKEGVVATGKSALIVYELHSLITEGSKENTSETEKIQ
jgi:TolB-like protein